MSLIPLTTQLLRGSGPLYASGKKVFYIFVLLTAPKNLGAVAIQNF